MVGPRSKGRSGGSVRTVCSRLRRLLRAIAGPLLPPAGRVRHAGGAGEVVRPRLRPIGAPDGLSAHLQSSPVRAPRHGPTRPAAPRSARVAWSAVLPLLSSDGASPRSPGTTRCCRSTCWVACATGCRAGVPDRARNPGRPRAVPGDLVRPRLRPGCSRVVTRGAFDGFHLSNVVDWLPAPEFEHCCRHRRAGQATARLVWRYLHCNAPIPEALRGVIHPNPGLATTCESMIGSHLRDRHRRDPCMSAPATKLAPVKSAR